MRVAVALVEAGPTNAMYYVLSAPVIDGWMQEEKDRLSRDSGLTMKQINNWFINVRRRFVSSSFADAAADINFPPAPPLPPTRTTAICTTPPNAGRSRWRASTPCQTRCMT